MKKKKLLAQVNKNAWKQEKRELEITKLQADLIWLVIFIHNTKGERA